MAIKDWFDGINTTAQTVVAIATVIALYKIHEQTKLSSAQLELQSATSDRSWTAELLGRAYDESIHRHVREETVRAYALLQRDLKKEVRLPLANLEQMNFGDDDQNLQKADFSSGRLWGVMLEGAKLQEANFKGADLGYASFKDADLTDADFPNAKLYWTDLSGSTLVNADFRGADFTQQDTATGAYTGMVRARNADFTGAVFDIYTRICHIDLAGADLRSTKDLKQHHLACAIVDGETQLPPHLSPPQKGACGCLANPVAPQVR